MLLIKFDLNHIYYEFSVTDHVYFYLKFLFSPLKINCWSDVGSDQKNDFGGKWLLILSIFLLRCFAFIIIFIHCPRFAYYFSLK